MQDRSFVSVRLAVSFPCTTLDVCSSGNFGRACIMSGMQFEQRASRPAQKRQILDLAPVPRHRQLRRAVVLLMGCGFLNCLLPTKAADRPFDLAAVERPRILEKAAKYLTEQPVTVTASHCNRSAGGKHDFFSEGDYWWPDPKNPDGPYIQRDGMTNPDNFVEHRRAMIRLSLIVPALAAAYKITKERKYADHAATHLRAWFIDDATRMYPNL